MLSILLLDESVSIKRAIEIGLQDWDPHIRALSSQVDAKEAIKRHKPHLVFIDVLASRRNGYELCKEMKDDAELKVFPVILLFSHFAPLDTVLFEQSRANASLEKPFRSEALRKCIKPLLPQDQQHPFQSYLEMPDIGYDMKENTVPPPETYRIDLHSTKQEGGIQNLEEQLLKASHVASSAGPTLPSHKIKTFTEIEEEKTLNKFLSPQQKKQEKPTEKDKKEIPLEEDFHFEVSSMEDLQPLYSHHPKNNFSEKTEDPPEGLSSSPLEKTETSPKDVPSTKTLKEICHDQLQAFLSSEAFLFLVREEVQKIFSHSAKQKELEKALQTAIEKALWQALPDKMERMIRDRIDDLTQEI